MSVTPTHKIKTNKTWKYVKNLRAGDKIYLLKSLTAKPTDYIKASGISHEATNGCISRFGSNIMGLFRKATMCITKMRTRLTTLLRIWSCLPSMITYRFMLKSICKILNILLRLGEISPRLGSMLNFGTVVKKVENGIVNTLNNRFDKSANVYASNAEKLTQLRSLLDQDSAAMYANQDGVEGKGSTTKHESAKCVGENMLRTDSVAARLVEEHVVQDFVVLSKRKENVYNIMVFKNHEYIANNMLVLNCIDATRYAISKDRTARTLKRRYSKDELGITF